MATITVEDVRYHEKKSSSLESPCDASTEAFAESTACLGATCGTLSLVVVILAAVVGVAGASRGSVRFFGCESDQ